MEPRHEPLWKTTTKRAVLYTLLFGGAIIVLLPLFWMVLTAGKQRGQALKFQFLPAATVQGPLKTLRPLEPGEATVTFEYVPKLYPKLGTPIEVSLAGEFNGWEKSRDQLVRDGSTWSVTLRNLKPGTYQYKFVVNGNKWVVDKSHDNVSGGNSVITLKSGFNGNRDLADGSRHRGDKVVFDIRRPGVESLQIQIKGRDAPIDLAREGETFTATLDSTDEPVEYRILEPQSFWSGLARIYTWQNFARVLANDDFPFARFFINSLLVAAGTAFLTVLICTMAGYAFAKKDFWGKEKLFMALLSTMMIPGMIFMVPQFAVVNKLGWINSYQGMIIPHLANIFGLFLLRQYIETIPDSLFEAAIIDGAGEWQIFKIIIVPLSLPIMVTLFLMTFVAQWGNFLWQLIVNTPDSPFRTLPVGLALFRGQYGQDWEMLMAGACFSIIPIAILFLMAQRFFIQGMTSGAVKE